MSSKDDITGNKGTSDFEGLPHEPASLSELLRATHVFAVEIISIEGTPFVTGADGLQHRSLNMTVKLSKLFKGKLDVEENKIFGLAVEQRRESELYETEFYGLWSHTEPEIGVRYLVVSEGASESPAALMQEGPLMHLLDISYEFDAGLAIEAERRYRELLDEANPEAPAIAVRELLELAHEKRTETKDVFGRYLWARVQAFFLTAPDDFLPAVAAIILAEDASLELRGSVVENLYATLVNVDTDDDLHKAVSRVFFTLLQQASASELHSTLIEVQLYNLLFKASVPRFPVGMILPDEAERNALQAKLKEFDTERARRLSDWLAS